jgi:small ligand-binding sensory domain FIST
MAPRPAADRLRFIAAHATHPDGHMALALAAAQLDAQRETLGPRRFAPTLLLLYLSDALAPQAETLLAEVAQRWPGVAVAGTVGLGVLANGVAYFQEPALVLWMGNPPEWEFRLFSGRQPLDWPGAETALVHASPDTPELGELVGELSGRTRRGELFGGISSGRNVVAPDGSGGGGQATQWAGGPLGGGLSGVAFGAGLRIVTRVSQGCQPVGPTRSITGAHGPLIFTLDDQPALPLLLDDLGIASLNPPGPALMRLRDTLAGLTDEGDPALGPGGEFGPDTRVRPLVGVDPQRGAVALAGKVRAGQQLAFCRRDTETARRDLVRMAAELREAIETNEEGDDSGWRLAGVHYVSCTSRGAAHAGQAATEMQWLRHALGDVPLIGFHAGGEIARHHLYSHTGVLTGFGVQAV